MDVRIFPSTFLPFEEGFVFENYFNSIHAKYWKIIVYPLTLFYVVVVVCLLPRWMKRREKFSLRRPLFYWNLGLAIFSVWGAFRSVPELFFTLRQEGLHHSICIDPDLDGPYGLWVVLFIWSKIWELGDTIFIILRKQPLIFLHWYHHVTVLFCVFFTINYNLSTVRYYVTMNYVVHSAMYTYYALKARGYPVAKRISILITSLQLGQMVVAFYITAYAFNEKVKGRDCNVDWANILLGILCYGSYFILFGHFFVKNYLSNSPRLKTSSNGTFYAREENFDKKLID